MENKSLVTQPKDEMVIYQTEDGTIKIDVLFDNDTVWLNVSQMAQLFNKEESGIRKHIINIFSEGELNKESNVNFLHVPFSDKPVPFYSLDVIISVGYRVHSHQGTQFRIWATQRVKSTKNIK